MKRFAWYLSFLAIIAATWSIAFFTNGVWAGWMLAVLIQLCASIFLEATNALDKK